MAGTLRLSNTGTGNGQSTITTAASGDTTYTLPSGGGTFVTTASTEALTVPFASGTAGSPSITFIGDTDTGIYSPGANQVAIATSGNASLYVASDGKVGIGTTSPSNALHIEGSSPSIRLKVTSGPRHMISPFSGDLYIEADPDNSSASTNLIFTVDGGEAARIDSSQRLLVGTSTAPSYTSADNFAVADTGNAGITIRSGTASLGTLAFSDATSGTGEYDGFIQYSQSSQYLLFGTASTERMRLRSDGKLLVAGTNDNGAYNIQCNGTGVWGFGAYVNGSDERLKENIHPLPASLDVVKALNPVAFQYKPEFTSDTSVQPGFIAQELQAALADQNYLEGVVQAGSDYLNVAYQSLIPVLTKAFQEALEKIETLEAEVAALKAQ